MKKLTINLLQDKIYSLLGAKFSSLRGCTSLSQQHTKTVLKPQHPWEKTVLVSDMTIL